MKNLLLIVGGGIAAYKTPDIIRQLNKCGVRTVSVLTKGGAKFITALTLTGVSGAPTYEKLFSASQESEMGHIQLSREADAILVCPATADLLRKMAHGAADDLASATLLAADKQIFVAPAMNVRMWEHPAVQENVAVLKKRGVKFIGPIEGDMACGEFGFGHLSEVSDIVAEMDEFLCGAVKKNTLKGKRVLVTAGPTFEALDAVRFIGNYSSGKQGYALAAACRNAGAEVVLVSGPCNLPDVDGVEMIKVQTAEEMLQACLSSLPCDVAICAAAVADWCVAGDKKAKIKKGKGGLQDLKFTETPDILQTLSKKKKGEGRPKLVIGFAAESDNLKKYAKEKLRIKGCDIILANKINAEDSVFGADDNEILFLSAGSEKNYPRMAKDKLAIKIVGDIAEILKGKKS